MKLETYIHRSLIRPSSEFLIKIYYHEEVSMSIFFLKKVYLETENHPPFIQNRIARKNDHRQNSLAVRCPA